MSLRANSARFLEEPRPPLTLTRVQARPVQLLALAQELNRDAQLREALHVTGTAILGVANDGVPLIIRLASPDVAHVLISGMRASGKTQLARVMLASLALYQKAREVQFVVCALKADAFEFLAQTPHLLGEIAATPERALQHLRWLENELERREMEHAARPRLVVVVDELSEFVQYGGREFQVHLARLAQRGQRAGISLVVCTSKANGGDINASWRANFHVQLIGKQTNPNDGAEKLAGRGDFILTAGGERVRFQAAYLAPENLPAFRAYAREIQARKNTTGAGLDSFVKRLRRVK